MSVGNPEGWQGKLNLNVSQGGGKTGVGGGADLEVNGSRRPGKKQVATSQLWWGQS